MNKLKFPKILYVAIEETGVNKEDYFFIAQSCRSDIDISVGEEREVAEYQLIRKKKITAIIEEL